MGEHSDRAQAYVDQATAYVHLDRLDDAVQSYARALEREEAFPNVRTGAWLSLPLLIATRSLADKYALALGLLDRFRERVMFPLDAFHWNAAYALILVARSQPEEAVAYAQGAVEAAEQAHSGFRYHPNVGLVGSRQAALVRRLKKIAQTR